MTIPEPVRTSAEREVREFCEQRIPAHIRDQVRLEVGVRGNAISIFERRPPWRPDFGPEWSRLKIAQLRYDPSARTWTLFWADRRGRWLPAPDVGPAPQVTPLLTEIDRDPTGAFWG
ncbi:MAG: DUF3024 domain-containing protein [Actinomycetota bacterium]